VLRVVIVSLCVGVLAVSSASPGSIDNPDVAGREPTGKSEIYDLDISSMWARPTDTKAEERPSDSSPPTASTPDEASGDTDLSEVQDDAPKAPTVDALPPAISLPAAPPLPDFDRESPIIWHAGGHAQSSPWCENGTRMETSLMNLSAEVTDNLHVTSVSAFANYGSTYDLYEISANNWFQLIEVPPGVGNLITFTFTAADGTTVSTRSGTGVINCHT